jgi:single-strand DNA-binding protein
VEVDDVGPSLRNASAKVNRVSRSRADSGSDNGRPAVSVNHGDQGGYGAPDPDPWASDTGGGYSDEPPF